MTVRSAGSTFIAAAVFAAIPTLVLAQKPNSENTPGARTKANDAQVCAADFAASAKPVAGHQRNEALKRYGKDASSYTGELDHLIPVALGGSNEPDNLWPMPENRQYGPAQKRELEGALLKQVCDKTLSLKAAQDAIRKDWTKAYDQYVKK